MQLAVGDRPKVRCCIETNCKTRHRSRSRATSRPAICEEGQCYAGSRRCCLFMLHGHGALHMLQLHIPGSSQGREVFFNVHSLLCVIQHVTLIEQGHFAGSVSVGKCIPAGQTMLTAKIQKTPGDCVDQQLLHISALRVREQSTRTFRIRTFDQPDSTLGCHTPYSSMGSNTRRRCPTSGSD
jgi:hypothetical protein